MPKTTPCMNPQKGAASFVSAVPLPVFCASVALLLLRPASLVLAALPLQSMGR